MGGNEPDVLVVEDEEDIRTLLLHHLRKDGYAARGAASGEEALWRLEERPADLVVLDLMLPGMDGMAVCRRIRADAAFRQPAILMLTARGEEEDMVSGLESGADDYVVKPFSNRVLMARVRSLLRRGGGGIRAGGDAGEVLTAGSLGLSTATRELTVAGTPVPVTAGEFRMLQVMLRRPGIVFSRSQILDLVRGALHAVTDRAVDVQVAGLRRKLGPAGRMIETVRGVGYRIRLTIDDSESGR